MEKTLMFVKLAKAINNSSSCVTFCARLIYCQGAYITKDHGFCLCYAYGQLWLINYAKSVKLHKSETFPVYPKLQHVFGLIMIFIHYIKSVSN